MKKLFFCFTPLLMLGRLGLAQMVINDQSVIYQQERMVYKQWDQNDFTPTHGFLYTNPLYWMTWAWFPNYHKTDLRPLAPAGPQSQRLALVAAMQNTDNAYKLQADTLRNTALSEGINYSGLLSGTDPLWSLYYSKGFKPLLNQQDGQVMNGVSVTVQKYLLSSGTCQWYLDESHSLIQRLQAARSMTLDRGARILAYHRMLAEYRKLSASWETKKQQAALFLALNDRARQLKPGSGTSLSVSPAYRNDQQIADDILKTSKL